MNKPSFCTQCPINHVTGDSYTPLKLRPGTSLYVGEASGEEEARTGEGFSGGAGNWLKRMVGVAGQKWESCSTLNVIGCHPPNNIFPSDVKWNATSREDGRKAVDWCTQNHLWPGVAKANRPKIYAVGGHALNQLTGKSGITTWRGSPLPLKGCDKPRVMPIIHPAALMRQAKLTSVTIGDIRKGISLPPENYNLFPSLADVERFKSRVFAFDFEWNAAGEITLCGLSDRFYSALVVPFIPPFIDALQVIFENAEELIGHNIIGADLEWIERLGWKLKGDVRIEDTMLKQHLCQPDFPHGLDFVASVFTQKVFWKGKGWEELDEEHEGEETPGQQWRTWDRDEALPRELGGYGGCLTVREAFALYNGRDTDAEFQINSPLSTMLRKWDLDSIYRNVSRPAAYICRWIGNRGLRLDTSRLGEIRAEIDGKITQLEERLPEGLRPYTKEVAANLPAPPGTYKPKSRICKGPKGQRHESVGILFTNPQDKPCPQCGTIISSGAMSLAKIIKGTKTRRITPYSSSPAVACYAASVRAKIIINRRTGNATTGKAARGIWAKDHPEFTLLGALKKQTTLRSNFAKDSLLNLDRMFFNLKVHGTNEGRLSSTGRRRGVDLNIQNQPKAFRKIYIPERSDWGFINIDISQGESWLTCWLAEDWVRWEKLQSKGYDEHSELASAIFNRQVSKSLAETDPELDEFRQIGKKTNHASSYGMGWKKFHEILVSEGYDQFTAADAKEFLATWARLNPGTVAWQKRTVQLMERQGYLRNPFGRVRWFSSRDAGTQCLAFLPASSLADCVLRMLIAHYPTQFQTELESEKVSMYHDLVEDYIMSIQVHDSLTMQGPWALREEQIGRSRRIMTQPWPQLNNFQFRVDVSTSNVSWGDCH